MLMVKGSNLGIEVIAEITRVIRNQWLSIVIEEG